eukprot:scaffold5043_cov115-Isochrysis_galbana.AAC.8
MSRAYELLRFHRRHRAELELAWRWGSLRADILVHTRHSSHGGGDGKTPPRTCVIARRPRACAA